MSSRLDYRVVNFLLACLGGAVAVYVAVTVPAPHPPGAPLLVPLDHSASPMVVYITGAVQHPGLYQVTSDARLYGAVQAAGGLTSEARTEGLNMARRLKDEEMITVPVQSAPASAPGLEAVTAGGSPTPCSARRPGRTGLRPAPPPAAADASQAVANTGSVEDLRNLPGMNVKLAERIVLYRASHGPLTSAGDLRNIPGCKRRWRRLGAALGLPDAQPPCP